MHSCMRRNARARASECRPGVNNFSRTRHRSVPGVRRERGRAAVGGTSSTCRRRGWLTLTRATGPTYEDRRDGEAPATLETACCGDCDLRARPRSCAARRPPSRRSVVARELELRGLRIDGAFAGDGDGRAFGHLDHAAAATDRYRDRSGSGARLPAASHRPRASDGHNRARVTLHRRSSRASSRVRDGAAACRMDAPPRPAPRRMSSWRPVATSPAVR